MPLLDEDYLILSTIHSAKGQEWKSVFSSTSSTAACPPTSASARPAEIEEERRLLYVAMTRAKDDLHLVVPQRFFVSRQRARRSPPLCLRTRFIPNAIAAHFEQCAWVHTRETGSAARNAPKPVDIGARLKSMWR